MKTIIIKILCWVVGIGVVGYVGLTIANSIPSINQLVGMVPVIGQIPTPIIEPLAEAIYDCSWAGENAEAVRISDAPKSEGSYPRWECVVKNPDASEEDYQEYLAELKKYKEWPRDPNYDSTIYVKKECEYYDGIWYSASSRYDSKVVDEFCVAPKMTRYYNGQLETLEYKSQHYDVNVIEDYSKN